jgi:hypothetical protein
MKDEKQIGYKDLSIPLQIAVVVSYIIGSLYALFFIMGIFSIVTGSG